ncbi:MAG: hypothetical protein WEB60_11240 [Terrimicrobiaceae bacterium]
MRDGGRGSTGLFFCLVLLVLGAFLFFERAGVNAREVNTRIDRTDQGAYITYATRLKESGFSYVGSRNRMPLYPAFVAITSGDAATPGDVFAKAKIWNVWLALACLGVIAAIFFARLPRHAAMNAIFLVSFTVLIFKAPHVQAEVLFYTLSFLFFFLGWELFRKPTILKGTSAGLTAGLAHLTKASILPGMFCFVVFYALDAVWMTRKKFVFSKRLMVSALTVVLLGAGFGVLTGPYLLKSKELHGSYFYNVNSTYYIWCDSWKEAVAITEKAKEVGGWKNLPPDEIPSPANYWRTHTPVEIVSRLGKGISRVFESMRKSYGYFPFLVGLSAASLLLAIHQRRLVWRLFLRRPFPILALGCYFGGYFVLIAWYSQIIMGNRFILALFLPYVFTHMVFLCTFSRGLTARIGGKPFSVPTLFQTAFSVWLLVAIGIICVFRIPVQYGGS